MTEQDINAVRGAMGNRIAVLLGGKSAEREISLKSGAAVVAALTRLGFEVQAVDVAEGDWQQQIAGLPQVFIALHGPGGEDGTVQGALECMGISYTGSGVMASALAMDKLRCKLLWKGAGLPSADFVELTGDTDWQGVIDRLGPVIVKPACEGSSIGMARAASAEELVQAWQAASQYGRVFAEQWLSGGEYTVAVLGGQALPVIKLETDAEFYDFNAKYISNDTRYLCPCGLDQAAEVALKNLALAAFDSLGCKGWGRVDVMQDASGAFYLLEVNTVPGMTDHSLVPMAARQAGLDFDQLVGRILAHSVLGEA